MALFVFWVASILVVAIAFNRVYRANQKFKSKFEALKFFPKASKLYYEEKTGRGCRRCKANGKIEFLIIRKRFRVTSDSGDLKIEELTHICVCPSCSYRGLSPERLGE